MLNIVFNFNNYHREGRQKNFMQCLNFQCNYIFIAGGEHVNIDGPITYYTAKSTFYLLHTTYYSQR